MTSATAANGFFIFDSDYLDNNGNSSGIGTGTAPAPHTGYLTSPTIDLTAYPNVVIEMSSYYRRFQSTCKIEFSTDGGSSWPFVMDLYGDNTALNEIAVNAATSTSHITANYVPVGVGGNANVKFRLTFDGTPGNANGNGYYFWMVDDIKISEAPHNDLSATKIYFDANDTLSEFYDYALIPSNQAELDTLRPVVKFANLGSVAQPNVHSGMTVTGQNSSTITSTASVASLPVNAEDSLTAGEYVPKYGVGTYNYAFYANSVDSTEDNTPNDSILYSVDVTNNEYAWATDVNVGYRTTTATSSYEICVYFDIHAADTAVAGRVEFNHNATDPNDPDNLVAGSDFLSFRVIDASAFDASNAYTGTNIAEYTSGGSSFYSVQAADLGNVISVPLTHASGTPTLSVGGYYLCVKTFNPNAFVASDGARSDDGYRSGVTIVDIDDANSWGGFAVCPTITLVTRNGIDPCAGTTITATTTTDETSQTNGEITASASGGTPSYSYAWTYPDGTTTGTGATLTGLSQAGDYKLTVTDALGCQSAEITSNLAGCVGLADVTLTQNVTDVTASGANDGSIDLTVTGGSGSFTYAWSGPAGFSSTLEDINNLAEGVYNVTVTDPQCAALTTDETIGVVITSINDITFAEDINIFPVPNTGEFTIQVSGLVENTSVSVKNVIGQVVYTGTISANATTKDISLNNAEAGVYFVDIKSESGEVATFKMVIK